MAEKHLMKCSTSLAIREVQIKTILIFHLTPVRTARINNTRESSCKQGEYFPLLVGMQTCVTTLEITMVIPQKDENLSTFISS